MLTADRTSDSTLFMRRRIVIGRAGPIFLIAHQKAARSSLDADFRAMSASREPSFTHWRGWWKGLSLSLLRSALTSRLFAPSLGKSLMSHTLIDVWFSLLPRHSPREGLSFDLLSLSHQAIPLPMWRHPSTPSLAKRATCGRVLWGRGLGKRLRDGGSGSWREETPS